MPLAPGFRIGPYEVTAQIGVGGMGEVYRATDTNLGRQVAIKVLPAAFVSDPERLARFDREARTLAALNHSNIAQIYGLERAPSPGSSQADYTALVMELVEGQTLADRIAQGPLPLDEALPIAKQIADGLEVAHHQGIIHRDLKPANIKVRPDGTVKILDFGLAKAMSSDSGQRAEGREEGIALSQSPTITSPALMTGVGMILGTAAYMSPEQARGKPVDKRADIWAFGCVFYEMLTGERAFDGEDVALTLAKVLQNEPDLTRTPTPVNRLLRRCLEKDPRRRLRDIGDASGLIDDRAPSATSIPPAPRSRLALAVWAAAVALVAIAAVVAWRLSPQPAAASPIRLSALLGGKAQFSSSSSPALSPDGTMLAYQAVADGVRSIWIRDLAAAEARVLPGTDGGGYFFWSPDSRNLAFIAEGRLKKVSVNGGTPQVICDALNGYVGSWSSSGQIVIGNFTLGLNRVSSSGGTLTRLTTLDAERGEIAHRYPYFLPDGKHLLFVNRNRDASKASIVFAELGDDGTLRERRSIVESESVMAFANGYLLFVRERRLMALRFNPATGAVEGEPVPVAEPVDVGGNTGQDSFSTSQTGVLAFTSGVVGSDSELRWLDRVGQPAGSVGAAGEIQGVRVSPDGKTVAFGRRDPQTGLVDIWLHDVTTQGTSRWTSTGRNNLGPVWSPDGAILTYTSLVNGVLTAYERGIRTASDAPVASAPPGTQPMDWSSAQAGLIGGIQNANTNWDVVSLPRTGGAPMRALVNSPAPERWPRVSPNGRWLAFTSNFSIRNEVYIQGLAPGSTRIQISLNGGTRPVWSRDGKELFFLGNDSIMAASITENGESVAASPPQRLFDVRMQSEFDVAPDGRFMVPVIPTREDGTPINIVLNWPSSIQK